MDWVAYVKYLQFFLKEFNNVATPFSIWYFWDALKPFICTQIDEKNRNIDNWQAVIK